MRIVILGTRGFPDVQGGVENYCEYLSVALVRKGYEVIVFTRKPYVNKDIKVFKGVKLVTLPALRQKSLEAFLHTFIGVFTALHYKPDILHIQAIGPALFTPLARLLGMKVVVTSHGANYKHLKWGRFAKLVLRLGEFLGVVFANKMIAISNTVADELKKKYDRETIVIPNGVVLPDIATSEDILKKYNLEISKYILSIGRIVPEKGFHLLVDAFNQLLTINHQLQTADYKLVIVGEADHPDKYSMDLKKKAGKNRNIVLTGFLAKEPLQELYSHAGLFVLPSYYEGLPIVLLEALSYQISVLASDIVANKEVGLQQKRYFKSGDVNDLRNKMDELLETGFSNEEKKHISKLLNEKYNWDKIAEQTTKVYNEAVFLK